MSWRDRLRPANFRGAAFFVLQSDFEGGRRTQVTEYVGREVTRADDLGRRAERFRVSAIVIGDDYLSDRDYLIARCTRPGPGYPRFAGGKLVHPYYGDLDVVCERISVREDVERGGAAFIDLDFVEADSGQVALGSVLGGPSQQSADAAAAAATQAAAAEATDLVVTEGRPELVRTAVAGAAAAGLGTVSSGLGFLSSLSVPSTLAPLAQVSSTISLAKTQVAQAITNVATLATTPADLVLEIVAAVEQIKVAASSALSSFYVYEYLFGLLGGDDGSDPTGSIAAEAQAKAAAVTSLLRRTAVAQASASAVGADWASRADAEAARARLLEVLASERLTASDAVASELGRLRQIVTAGVPSPDQALPSVRTVVPAGTTSSVLVAYEQTGSVAGEQALVERNRLREPGFIAAGSELEVLVGA